VPAWQQMKEVFTVNYIPYGKARVGAEGTELKYMEL
jgi:hypothetical protein